MNGNNPDLWASIVSSLSQYRLGWFTSISAFVIAVWSGLIDGKGWGRSIFGGIICVFIAIALVAVLKISGMHSSWLPIVGVFVGFIGAERIRDAILGAWETRKSKLVDNNENDSKK